MKVINQGESNGCWWIGITLVCPKCSRSVLLEEGDRHSHKLTFCKVPESVIYDCENCHNKVEAINPKATQIISEASPKVANPGFTPAPVGNVKSVSNERSHPAPVGNVSSTGYGNPFKGTSWGV